MGRSHSHHFLAAGPGHLLEGEIAGQRLPGHAQSDAISRDAQIRTGGQVQRNRRGADQQLLGHGVDRVVDLHREGAGELHVRARVHADHSGERTRQTFRRHHEEADAIIDGDDGRTAAAKFERKLRSADAHNLAAASLGELLHREITAQRLAEDGKRKPSAFHAQIRAGRQIQGQAHTPGAQGLPDRPRRVVDFYREVAGEHDVRHVHHHAGAQLSGHAGVGHDECSVAARHCDRRGRTAQCEGDVGRGQPDHLRPVGRSGLLEHEIPSEGLAFDFHADVRGFESHIRSGGQIQHRRHRTHAEGLGHRRGRVIDPEQQVTAERDAGDVQRDTAAELAGQSLRAHHEGSPAIGQTHVVRRAVTQLRREIHHREPDDLHRRRGDRRDLLEREIAAQSLAEQMESNSESFDPQIRTGGQGDLNLRSGEREGLAGRLRGAVDAQGEIAVDADAGNVEANRSGQLTRQAGLGEQQDAPPIGHRDEASRAVAQVQTDIAGHHRGQQFAASGKRPLEDEIPGQPLTLHRQAGPHACDPEEWTGRQIKAQGLTRHDDALAHGSSGRIDFHDERPGKHDVRHGDGHCPADRSGQARGRQEEEPAGLSDPDDILAETKADIARGHAERASRWTGSHPVESEVSAEHLPQNVQRDVLARERRHAGDRGEVNPDARLGAVPDGDGLIHDQPGGVHPHRREAAEGNAVDAHDLH